MTVIIAKADESKRQQAKAQTRKALLKSALKLYSQQGAKGLSMNKVAKGAGIAQPSFYNHFPNLDSLVQELSLQLQENYMGPLRIAVLGMLKDVDQLSPIQFRQQLQQCLQMIFNAAFQNIQLFQHVVEDRPRFQSDQTQGLGMLLVELQNEWTQVLKQGLALAGRQVPLTCVHLFVDSASAQIHELIMGCQEGRYSQDLAINSLSKNLAALFNQTFEEFFQTPRKK